MPRTQPTNRHAPLAYSQADVPRRARTMRRSSSHRPHRQPALTRPNARSGRGATRAAEHRTCAPLSQANRPSPVSAIASIGLMALQNDDGRGSVRGVRDRWRAERSPSAKSELPKVGSMTTPIAEYGRTPDRPPERHSRPIRTRRNRTEGRRYGACARQGRYRGSSRAWLSCG